ncbi:MAG: ABC transporter substrate-binding protein [Actinomycetota bacterium]
MQHRRGRSRMLAIGATCAVVLALAACGDDDDTASSTSAQSPTTVAATAPSTSEAPTTSATPTSAPPDTDVPTTAAPTTTEAIADDRTIVALDEQTAFALLSIGVTPAHVLTTLNSETFAALNSDLGIPTTEFVIAEPSFEVVAGLDPDLLVGIENPFLVERASEYEQIAPLVTTPLDASWEEQLQVLAVDFEATDRAASVIAAVDAFEADTAQALADQGAAGSSVSVMTVRLGNILAVNASGATGEILTAVDLTRPAAQLAEGPPGIPFVPVSPETVGEHDADLLVLGQGVNFDVAPLVDSPIYGQLGAVQNGAVADVVGDAWILGGTGFATYWVLQDLVDILVDGGAPAGFDDTSARWTSFLELTS